MCHFGCEHKGCAHRGCEQSFTHTQTHPVSYTCTHMRKYTLRGTDVLPTPGLDSTDRCSHFLSDPCRCVHTQVRTHAHLAIWVQAWQSQEAGAHSWVSPVGGSIPAPPLQSRVQGREGAALTLHRWLQVTWLPFTMRDMRRPCPDVAPAPSSSWALGLPGLSTCLSRCLPGSTNIWLPPPVGSHHPAQATGGN